MYLPFMEQDIVTISDVVSFDFFCQFSEGNCQRNRDYPFLLVLMYQYLRVGRSKER